MIQNHAISKYPASFCPEMAHYVFIWSTMMSPTTPFPLSKILQELMPFSFKNAKTFKKFQDGFAHKNSILLKISTLGTQNDSQHICKLDGV